MLSFISDAVAGLTGLRAGGLAGVDPWDDRWYAPGLGGITGAGVHVTPDTIYHCGVVLAALRFRADIFSQSQPTVYKSLGSGRREEVEDHYARVTLRDPCTWMTGVRWRHLQMIRAQLGNSHNLIRPGPSSFADFLNPIEPARINVKDQRSDGTLVYEYRPENAPMQMLGQERILHFRGFSTDGFEGLAMWQLLRNAVGIALLAEKHTATFLRKGNRIAGLLIPQGDIGGKEKRAELAASVNEAFGNHENTGQMGVLPWNVEFKPLAMDNVKAQLLELRDHQVGDLLRFLGVPGVVVGWGEKTATFASAEAFFEEARRCVLPWVVNFEAEEMKALLPRDGGLSIKHNLDSVLRADTAKRYEAIFKAAGRPWITGNEARATEDMDPIDDPSMNKVAPPPNTNGRGDDGGPGGQAPPVAPAPRRPTPKPAPPDDEADARTLRGVQLAVDAAARVVRREVAALKDPRTALRFARDAAGWREWVTAYYEKYATHVADALHLTAEQARTYADSHRDELLAGGLGVVDGWEADSVPRLAFMALGDEDAMPARPAAPVAVAAPPPVPVVVNIRNVIRRQKPPLVEVITPPAAVSIQPQPERKPRTAKVEYGKDGRIASVREE